MSTFNKIIAIDFTLVEQFVLMFVRSFINALHMHVCLCFMFAGILWKLHGVHNSNSACLKSISRVVFQLHFIEYWIISLHTAVQRCTQSGNGKGVNLCPHPLMRSHLKLNSVKTNVNFQPWFNAHSKLNYRQCLSSILLNYYELEFITNLCFSKNRSFSSLCTDTGRHPSANYLRF